MYQTDTMCKLFCVNNKKIMTIIEFFKVNNKIKLKANVHMLVT